MLNPVCRRCREPDEYQQKEGVLHEQQPQVGRGSDETSAAVAGGDQGGLGAEPDDQDQQEHAAGGERGEVQEAPARPALEQEEHSTSG